MIDLLIVCIRDQFYVLLYLRVSPVIIRVQQYYLVVASLMARSNVGKALTPKLESSRLLSSTLGSDNLTTIIGASSETVFADACTVASVTIPMGGSGTL